MRFVLITDPGMARMGRNVALFVMSTVMMAAAMKNLVNAAPSTAGFVYGDSLVDAGNNNYIVSLAKANFQPYGIDRPDKQPTGRFCNGRNIADLMSKFSIVLRGMFVFLLHCGLLTLK